MVRQASRNSGVDESLIRQLRRLNSLTVCGHVPDALINAGGTTYRRKDVFAAGNVRRAAFLSILPAIDTGNSASGDADNVYLGELITQHRGVMPSSLPIE